MPKDAELPVPSEPDQWLALEDTALLTRELAHELTAEEEVAAVNPAVDEVRLLDELRDSGVILAQLAEARGRIDSENGAKPALSDVEVVLLRQVGIGEPVAVGHREMRSGS